MPVRGRGGSPSPPRHRAGTGRRTPLRPWPRRRRRRTLFRAPPPGGPASASRRAGRRNPRPPRARFAARSRSVSEADDEQPELVRLGCRRGPVDDERPPSLQGQSAQPAAWALRIVRGPTAAGRSADPGPPSGPSPARCRRWAAPGRRVCARGRARGQASCRCPPAPPPRERGLRPRRRPARHRRARAHRAGPGRCGSRPEPRHRLHEPEGTFGAEQIGCRLVDAEHPMTVLLHQSDGGTEQPVVAAAGDLAQGLPVPPRGAGIEDRRRIRPCDASGRDHHGGPPAFEMREGGREIEEIDRRIRASAQRAAGEAAQGDHPEGSAGPVQGIRHQLRQTAGAGDQDEVPLAGRHHRAHGDAVRRRRPGSAPRGACRSTASRPRG